MKCKHCGEELLSGARFCQNCGTVVTEEKKEEVFQGEVVDEKQGFEDFSYGGTTAESTMNSQAIYEEEPKKSSALSIAALVIGILSLVCCCCGGGFIGIAGIIIAVIAMNTGSGERGLAVAGLVCSIIGTVLFLMTVLVSLIGGVSSNVYYDDFYNGFYSEEIVIPEANTEFIIIDDEI